MSEASRVVAILVNINCKEGPARLAKVLPHLGLDEHYPHLYFTSSEEEAVQLVRSLILNYDNPIILSISGDGGTSRIMAESYICLCMFGRSATIMPLGGGTKNDILECLYPGFCLEQLAEMIERGRTNQLDLIEVTTKVRTGVRQTFHAIGSWGVGAIGYGNAAIERWQQANRKLPDHQRLKQTKWREIQVIWKGALRGLKTIEVFFVTESKKRKRARLVNWSVHSLARIAGELYVNPKANPADGILEIKVVKARPWIIGSNLRAFQAVLIALAARLHLSRCRPLPRGEVLTFRHRQPLIAQCDGKSIKLEPGTVEVHCVPQAVTILAA